MAAYQCFPVQKLAQVILYDSILYLKWAKLQEVLRIIIDNYFPRLSNPY